MRRRGHARHLFAAAHSARGFRSLHAELAEPHDRIFLVTGAGGGSALVRQLAAELLAQGHDLDVARSPTDSDDFEGLYAPGLGLAVLDGSHLFGPGPGWRGGPLELLDLGSCVDRSALEADRTRLHACTQEGLACYRHALRYLAAAAIFLRDIERHVDRSGARHLPALNAIAFDLIDEILPARDPAPRSARHRRRFASAVTADGFRNFMDTVFHPLRQRYILRGYWGTGKSTIVAKIRDEALARGYDVESYPCALDPERVDHLVLPGSGVGVITSEPPHVYEPRNDDVFVDSAQALDAARLARVNEDIDVSHHMYARCTELAIAWLGRVRRLQRRRASLYAHHLDGDAFAGLAERLRLAVAERAARISPASAAGGAPG